MKYIAFIVLGLVLLAAIGGIVLWANKHKPQAALPQPQIHRTIWDELLAKPEYSNEVARAGLDLPTDEWTNGTWGPSTKIVRINASKWRRIGAVTDKALGEVKPKLKEMSVSNLVYCFELVDYSRPWVPDSGGVAEIVFWNGNFLIKRELESRSLDDLKVLRTFRNDKVAILENSQSDPSPLPWQLDEIFSDVRDRHTIVPTQAATNH
jgi:hypothetical protein